MAEESDRIGAVLVLEDEPLVRLVTAEYLRMSGFPVLEAGSADDALRLCQEHAGPIAALLTDVAIPGTPGPEVARRVAALRPGLPVVYMSGHPKSALVQSGSLAATEVVLQKPFTRAQLVAALTALAPSCAELARCAS